MNAWDKARDAAAALKQQRLEPEVLPFPHQYADAASKPWADALCDLLEYFDLACRFASPPDEVIHNLDAARKRAVEAIGD